MSFFPYFVCELLGVDSLRGGLAEANRILSHSNYPSSRQMQATFPLYKTSCKMRKATRISSFLFN